QGVVGGACGLTGAGTLPRLAGATAVSGIAPVAQRPRALQLSNGRHWAVEQALANSDACWGAPKKHPTGPRPDDMQTPERQTGWLPNFTQSASVLHCWLRSTSSEQAATEPATRASADHQSRELRAAMSEASLHGDRTGR